MRITELLKRESIELDVAADSKEEAIDKLVSLMDAGGRLNDKAGYKGSGKGTRAGSHGGEGGGGV